ncbi:MAG: carboxy-S-adenosyl-L-methionine synthase CmoA [Xanthomonadales bacterium]|nr:carboxy-S-adenosyl-L-methionine synthase CmoA [Gammaproteobacteria bacterium]MBT8053012.1 carboxy-S-adenosyl-L-methionine synthase CmoA [Gammaproteobacteria bacterium]NND57904.1 carboxy-S-adenosyl-L-methionine synthase CmoA [Xanthomonadales bacterium]NNK50784.1 carboxy-S-adenosyl-L-methionine synthase CmoA [Xanthomonadales bacterium]
MNQKDRLFDTNISKTGDFVFDDRVVSVFPDMINRSVPGYGLVVPMIGMLARRYAQNGTNLYDLGCSLGAVSIAMQTAVRAEDARILAVDNSADMIRQFHAVLESEGSSNGAKIELLQQDVLETPIENASVVVLNFTLQFVEPDDRKRLLERIAGGLNPGGILVLSEKICFEDTGEQELQTSWHHDFKRSQGYSELEIARKRDALENVMKPETLERHRKRLREAGFERICQWFQGFNFVSMVAFGPPE